MRHNNFTLIEMVAVIAVTSFLVVMTINVMKTDPTSAQLAQLGGSCLRASSKAARQMTDVLVEFDGTTFKSSYINDAGKKIVFKEFIVSKKVDAKMEKNGSKITSFTVTPQGTVDGGGAKIIFKVRKLGDTQALFFSVNGFTSRVFYYDNSGAQVTAW